jgi:hypothetical protein
MKHKVTMAELQTSQSHSHPAFNVSGQKHQTFVFNYYFQVRFQEFQHEIQIRLGREDIQKLGTAQMVNPTIIVHNKSAHTHTSITFWCLSSRRYFTSRIADMSSPSLNCPTLIFLIAIFRPVTASRPASEMLLSDSSIYIKTIAPL